MKIKSFAWMLVLALALAGCTSPQGAEGTRELTVDGDAEEIDLDHGAAREERRLDADSSGRVTVLVEAEPGDDGASVLTVVVEDRSANALLASELLVLDGNASREISFHLDHENDVFIVLQMSAGSARVTLDATSEDAAAGEADAPADPADPQPPGGEAVETDPAEETPPAGNETVPGGTSPGDDGNATETEEA